MMRALSGLVAVAALLLGSCSGSDDGKVTPTSSPAAVGHDTGEMSNGVGMPSEDTLLGEPGAASEVDRTVEVALTDDLRFEPARVPVGVGETIEFRVTNAGQMPHEFVLGDQSMQEQHEAEMAEMGGSMPPDEPYAIGLDAGETTSVIWKFTVRGTIQYGCHEPGHYAGGMLGEIEVT